MTISVRFLVDDLPDPNFDNHGVTSFYGTCDPDIVQWDTDINFELPISEQYGPHMKFIHVQ